MTSELGPALFNELNSRQWVGNMKHVVYGKGGMSAAAIKSVETQLGFALPPDFTYLLQNMRDDGNVFFPWSKFDKAKYDAMIDDVWEGIEFDIRQDDVWLYRWGKRPHALDDAVAVARRDFTTWPKLVPIHSHRFLAAEPCATGNPVFSIVQTDIIYYGSNLANYLTNEFLDQDWAKHTQGARHIAVWSDFAEDRDRILATGWGKRQ